jgi:hypothetical protein
MNNEKWQQLYMLAATEVDGNKIPERIAAVREAIRGDYKIWSTAATITPKESN